MEVSGRRTFEDISSAEDGELFCQPCSSDDDWVVAKGYCQNCNEYLCTVCLKVHRKQSVSKNHVILEDKRMPKSPVQSVGMESCSDLCLKHSNEILKFYCHTHDAIGCSDCIILDHKSCKVQRIQDISRDYFKGHEHKQLLGKVQKLLENIDEVRISIEVAGQDVNASFTQAVADIKAFRKEINDYLDIVQAEILTEVNKRKEKDEMTISNITVEYQSLRKEIEMFNEKLQQQSNKTSALFVAAKQMNARMTSFESTINKMVQDINIKQYRFEPASNINQVLSSHAPFGNLSENIEQRTYKTNISDMDVQFDGEITINQYEDTRECHIMSSVLILPNHILLADYNNKCLKIVNVELGKLSSRYNLTSEPWNVAVVSSDFVAVTLPEKQKIQFLSITNQNTLTDSHDIKVIAEVRNIACQNDNLIIGYRDKIEIVTITGKVMKTISSADLSLITSIATAPDSKTFYVGNSDYDCKPTAIYKFDFDGNQLATYKDIQLQCVRGITVTPDGTVLACNRSENGSIHLISPDCKKIKEILLENDQVKFPYCVSFCNGTNRLFLCNFPGDQNVLKMFQMK